jgi:hypothetical protein
MSDIATLEQRVEVAQAELNTARAALNKALIAAHPTKVGDILIDKKGRRGQVDAVHISYGCPRPMVRLFKKDGSLGKRVTTVYSWDGWTQDDKPEPRS